MRPLFHFDERFSGPARVAIEAARLLDLATEDHDADACHLCYEARRKLRGSFPDVLGPDQMYGVLAEG